MKFAILKIESNSNSNIDNIATLTHALQNGLPSYKVTQYDLLDKKADAFAALKNIAIDDRITYLVAECHDMSHSLIISSCTLYGHPPKNNITFDFPRPLEIIKPVIFTMKEKMYLLTQSILNSAAEKVYQKKSVNPNPQPFVNTDFPISKQQIDDKNYLCHQNINYNDIAYIHQPRVFDCVDISVLMLLNYHETKCKDISLSDDEKKHLVIFRENFHNRKTQSFAGKTTDDVKEYSSMLVESNLKATGKPINIEQLAYYLYKNGPLMIRLDEIGGHFAVLKGIVDNTIILHDPWYGPDKTCSFDTFMKNWDGTLVYFLMGYSKSLELERAVDASQSKLR